MKRLLLIGLTGAALLVPLAGGAFAADRSQAMSQHMRLMEAANPGMQRMMELMDAENPGMERVMDAPPFHMPPTHPEPARVRIARSMDSSTRSGDRSSGQGRAVAKGLPMAVLACRDSSGAPSVVAGTRP